MCPRTFRRKTSRQYLTSTPILHRFCVTLSVSMLPPLVLGARKLNIVSCLTSMGSSNHNLMVIHKFWHLHFDDGICTVEHVKSICSSYKFVLSSLKNLSTILACFLLFYDDIFICNFILFSFILYFTLYITIIFAKDLANYSKMFWMFLDFDLLIYNCIILMYLIKAITD